MASKPQRRQRWVGLSTDQVLHLISDDLDDQEDTLADHIQDDLDAHAATAKILEEWRLDSLRERNKLLVAVILTLITALVSVVIALATIR